MPPSPTLISRRIMLGSLAALPLVRRAAGQVVHRITILHMNDFHSRHDPVDGRAITCKPGPSDCFGSSPRLATAIKEQRRAAQADGRTVLLLDAGDQFQGSLFYTAHHGMAELAVQHAIGTEAMTLGNHEFDNGPASLARYVAAARFPVLSANVDVSAEPELAPPGRPPLIQPWTLLEKDGLPIAVIGLTTRETVTSSSPGPNIRFGQPKPALAAAVQAARAAGARLVVALSHMGLPIDRTLDTPGVSVIVGGHSHLLLSNDEPGAVGPAPLVNPAGALIVQAQAYGRYLGRLDLDLDAQGNILAYAAACRHIGQDTQPDPEVAAIVAAFAAPLAALRNRPVATLPASLEVATCRIAPCPLGRRVADAMRQSVRGATIGLMNAGGLRVGLPAGPVTLGQVLDTMPFANTLATVTVTGADLQALLRHGLTMTGRGGYAQWAGLRLTLAGTIETELPDSSWAPLDLGRDYLLATNNFLRNGGDGYTPLRDNGRDAYDSGPDLADLLAESLARKPD